MKTMKTRVLAAVVAALALLAAPGCTEEELRSADRTVRDANAVGDAVTGVARSPAGALIPLDVRMIMELLGVGLAAAYTIWQRIRAAGILERNADLGVTLKAIADGIDASGRAADDIKTNILAIMTQRHIYDTADAIIDEHRSKLAT